MLLSTIVPYKVQFGFVQALGLHLSFSHPQSSAFVIVSLTSLSASHLAGHFAAASGSGSGPSPAGVNLMSPEIDIVLLFWSYWLLAN